MRILVITISDRASRGEYEDMSGPAVEAEIVKAVEGAEVERSIVPDEREKILEAMRRGLGADVILTTGGTGLGPRDITPEVTAEFCDREAPGLAELLRSESACETMNAWLSRGRAGLSGSTLVINLPGSVAGASFSARVLAPLLVHAVSMASGGGH